MCRHVQGLVLLPTGSGGGGIYCKASKVPTLSELYPIQRIIPHAADIKQAFQRLDGFQKGRGKTKAARGPRYTQK